MVNVRELAGYCEAEEISGRMLNVRKLLLNTDRHRLA
jgi:hypothetical protein